MSNKLLLGLALSVLLLATLGFVMPVHAQATTTVYFWGYPHRGYVCLAPEVPIVNNTLIPPICLSNNIPGFNMSATVPSGNYTVFYVPTENINGYVIVQVTGNSTVNSGVQYNSNADWYTTNVTLVGNSTSIVVFAP